MPMFVVEKVQNALNDRSKPLRGSHIHLLGMAYKRNIDDVRESPALDIALLLEKRGARVTYSDPYVPSVSLDSRRIESHPVEEMVPQADCVVIVTDHSAVDYGYVAREAKLIVDTRNALKGYQSDKIVRL
jgi:UDP-N-acetyl-D-glucosamine dehydrogenase